MARPTVHPPERPCPLGARPPAGLAPPRGQARVVALLRHRDGHAPGDSSTTEAASTGSSTTASMAPRRSRRSTATGSTPTRNTRSRPAIGRRIRPSSATSCSSASVASTRARSSTSIRAGELVLKRASNSAAPHPIALMDHNVIDTAVLRDAIARVAEWASRTASTPRAVTGRSATFSSALHRGSTTWGRVMPCDGRARTPLPRRLASCVGLDCSCLPIQGPPGTGKTFTSAYAIVDLDRGGQAGRHHRHQPRRHHEPSRRGDARGGDAQVVITAMQKASTVRAVPIPM